MPKGGARVGAGRKGGGKNKATIEREASAAKGVEEAKATGRMPKETLLELHRYYMGLVAKHAPNGPEPDTKKFERYSIMAGDFANKAAPFYHPRLATVAVTDNHVDLTRLSDAELAQYERLTRRATAQPGTIPGSDRSGAEATKH